MLGLRVCRRFAQATPCHTEANSLRSLSQHSIGSELRCPVSVDLVLIGHQTGRVRLKAWGRMQNGAKTKPWAGFRER